jgi:hypothetical protein
MTTIDNLKNNLIDKILSVSNEKFLIAIDNLITSTNASEEVVVLTSDQKQLLNLSEKDIEQKLLISQDEMVKRNLEWLNAK